MPLEAECPAIREQKLPDHLLRFRAMIKLGHALAGQGKFDEAEPLLLAGQDGILDQSNAPAVYKREAIERLVHLYEDWNKAEEAADWRKLLSEAKPPQTPHNK